MEMSIHAGEAVDHDPHEVRAVLVARDDVVMAVFSGLEDFPQAEAWIAKDEETYIRALPGRELAQQMSGKINWHPIEFTDGAYENFAHSLDLFKDRSLVLVQHGERDPFEGGCEHGQTYSSLL